MTEAVATDSVLDNLFMLVDMGVPVFPLHGIRGTTCACREGNSCGAPGKHPLAVCCPQGVKNATLDKVIIREWHKRFPGANWAAACGGILPGGGYLVVLDRDSRNGGDETIASWPELPETVRAITGGGDNDPHYYLRSPVQMASRTAGPGVDLRGWGAYVVIPYSKHYKGGTYTWDAGAHPSETKIADLPQWLLAGEVGQARPTWDGVNARFSMMGEAFSLAGWLGADGPNGSVHARCPWNTEHSDARGRGGDSSTVILPPTGGSNSGNFSCAHSHCSGRKWTDVIKALPAAAVSQARAKFPFKPIVLTTTEVEVPSAIVIDPQAELRDRLLYKKGKEGVHVLLSDIVNINSILSHDPRWKGVLKWDEFAAEIRYAIQPPWHPEDQAAQASDIWRDSDADRIVSWMRRYWDLSVTDVMAYKAAVLVAHKAGTHPVRDYLEGLTWDGFRRMDNWLHVYLGVTETEYARMVGKFWLLAAVARIMKPGCKADHVLILEGPQGIRKSTALGVLAGAGWFNDTPFDMGSKDGYLALRGKWIVELAELETMRNAEASKAKAFFSRGTDSYRPPYGRSSIDVPRQCVFAGSVNQGQYLRDETGNRRYWPVRCGVIDLDKLTKERDQLWAEVFYYFKQGEKWWPEAGVEAAMCRTHVSSREEADYWDAVIGDWIGERTEVDIAKVLQQALKMDPKAWGRSEQVRCRNSLVRLGWIPAGGSMFVKKVEK